MDELNDLLNFINDKPEQVVREALKNVYCNTHKQKPKIKKTEQGFQIVKPCCDNMAKLIDEALEKV